ncbi:MAG: cold shock domain-containing protein [Dechloromonas sp.]|jgi:cold shock CspA family protein|nr:cold shock domain-containing protein [Dechloromonas sp.]
MRIEGTLKQWNDDRGFGFIAPNNGGPEIFVHVSAFPRDGIRPRIGERLSFEIETSADGKKQAKRLLCHDRTTVGKAAQGAQPPRRAEERRGTGWLGRLLPALLIAGLGYYSYTAFIQRDRTLAPATLQVATPEPVTPSFRCDGRQHCSQMTSCAEAEYFLRHCPAVKMDGDGDGRPCETGPC